jgi:hypothetical protein
MTAKIIQFPRTPITRKERPFLLRASREEIEEYLEGVCRQTEEARARVTARLRKSR